jgi:hypothetical protein
MNSMPESLRLENADRVAAAATTAESAACVRAPGKHTRIRLGLKPRTPRGARIVRTRGTDQSAKTALIGRTPGLEAECGGGELCGRSRVPLQVPANRWEHINWRRNGSPGRSLIADT